MKPDNNEAEMPEKEPQHGSEPANDTLEQKADLSAIMHFNSDRRFSITE